MRHPSPGDALSSWREYKERGRDQFQSENYPEALAAYRSAVAFENVPDAERQVLLSNIVACRLKLGGPAMASAAVEEAKQCVSLNDRWAKGHVRLASAYIALGGHSNDACNSLQTALSLDPGNANARTMLMKELRRDRVARTGEGDGGGNEGSGSSIPEPSAPPAEDVDPTTGRPYSSAPPPRSSYSDDNRDRRHNDTNRPQPQPQPQPHPQHDIDDSPTLSERFQFYVARATTWWFNDLSDDGRALIKVLFGLTILYVAMGGRFGLDNVFGAENSNRGHYDTGNAYDRFYGRGSTAPGPTGAGAGGGGYSSSGGGVGGGGYSSSSSYSQGGGRSTYDQYEYAPRNSRGNSYHVPNLFDGSPLSIIVLVIFGFTCHHFGFNPFHALWMLNIVTGNRGRGMHRMGGMGGIGMMGMGYGMMNGGMRRGGFGGRRRGG